MRVTWGMDNMGMDHVRGSRAHRSSLGALSILTNVRISASPPTPPSLSELASMIRKMTSHGIEPAASIGNHLPSRTGCALSGGAAQLGKRGGLGWLGGRHVWK
eukprot:524979-Prymnesium_polylepis.1